MARQIRQWRASSRNFWLLVGAGLLVVSAQLAIGVAVFFPSALERFRSNPVVVPEPMERPYPVDAPIQVEPPTKILPQRAAPATPRRARYVCVASDDTCRCSTRQGARVQVSESMCRDIALHGDLQVLAR